MIYAELTKKAINIAYHAHDKQMDRGGMPYILHPLHVAEQMQDEYTTVAALLHDVVEDTSYTIDDLRHEGMPEEVLHSLQLLTHQPDIEYMQYIQHLKTDRIARCVKIADLQHNSDISRLKTIRPADIKRVEKYSCALSLLTD